MKGIQQAEKFSSKDKQQVLKKLQSKKAKEEEKESKDTIVCEDLILTSRPLITKFMNNLGKDISTLS